MHGRAGRCGVYPKVTVRATESRSSTDRAAAAVHRQAERTAIAVALLSVKGTKPCCGRTCELTTPKCCECSDKRSNNPSASKKYEDGVGFVYCGRHEFYCPSCRERGSHPTRRLECGHICLLTKATSCCECGDERAHEVSLSTFRLGPFWRKYTRGHRAFKGRITPVASDDHACSAPVYRCPS